MKTFFLAAIFLLLVHVSFSQEGKSASYLSAPVVDKRVELLSIVARLAGYQEYNSDDNKVYVQEIHQYFDKFKEHPLIKFMREIRSTNSIGYDAVMSMAIHLEQPPSLKPLVKFTKTAPDKRWGADTAAKFATLLQQFYIDTDFEAFFKAHENNYKTAEQQFTKVFEQLDVDWYYKYYGKAPKEKFNVIVGLGNGGGNYGSKIVFPDKRESIYAIMGSWSFDSTGTPEYKPDNYLPTLIHEFNHSFINYLTEKNEKKLQNSGQLIYDSVKKEMQVQAYGEWKTMMSEALVRASVVRYLIKHNSDPKVADKELQLQLQRGFYWLKELVDLLGTYESERKKYPTLESFMPKIVSFYNATATNISAIKEAFTKTLVHVSFIQELKNGNTNIDPGLTELKIFFNKPLSGKGYSINLGNKGREHFPITGIVGYSNDNQAFTVKVKLQPNFDYQFILTGNSFKSADGYPLKEYEVNFKTK